jgi:ABC-2 type transport system ATP-binding protein
MTEDRACVISTHQGNEVEKMLDEVIILDHKGLQLQASVERICKKLLFKEISADEHPAGILYAEPSLGGNRVVLPNTGFEESAFSVELLFNAVYRAGDRVREALV